ncbi:MAG: RecX family transcriptional regulator [Anaerolineae bacterium]|nr:RecX family transcriptional regulator [Anaerolineae bacterium]
MAGTITALKAQRGKERVNIYLDGRFAFGLALVHAVWLKVGQKLSDDEIAELQAADTVEQARLRALDLISYRPRSVREVQLRLKKAGADDEAIAQVVERLKEAGLLDDDAFSRAWVDSRMRASPRSKRMIAWELRQKGVSGTDIEAALAEVDEEDAACRAALQRLPRLRGLAPMERKRKLYEHLARKGFDYETIERAIEKVESSREGC